MTYYNDGVGPDPYPRPGGTFPFTASDLQIHAITAAWTHVTLTVIDDDGGSATQTLNPLVRPVKRLLTCYDVGKRDFPVQEEAFTSTSRFSQNHDHPPLEPSPPSGG